METDWDTEQQLEAQEWLDAERHRVKINAIGHELPTNVTDDGLGRLGPPFIRKPGFPARFPGTCQHCLGRITLGQMIFSNDGERGYFHSTRAECTR